MITYSTYHVEEMPLADLLQKLAGGGLTIQMFSVTRKPYGGWKVVVVTEKGAEDLIGFGIGKKQ